MAQGPLRGALYSQGCPSTRSVNSCRFYSTLSQHTLTAHSHSTLGPSTGFKPKISVNTVCQLCPSTRSVNSVRQLSQHTLTAHSVRQTGVYTRHLSVQSVRQLGLSTLGPHSVRQLGLSTRSVNSVRLLGGCGMLVPVSQHGTWGMGEARC